jgi:hypothetical protein
MWWQAPADWLDRIFVGPVLDGDALTTDNFRTLGEPSIAPVIQKIEDFIKRTREREKFQLPDDIPQAVMILACIKYKSPLPNEFWRWLILGEQNQGVSELPQ